MGRHLSPRYGQVILVSGTLGPSAERLLTARSLPKAPPQVRQNVSLLRVCLGTLSIQPKIPEILVGSSNGTDHFGLVRPEYSGPAGLLTI